MVQLTPPPESVKDRAVYDYLYQLQEYLSIVLGHINDGLATEKDLLAVGDTAERAGTAADRALYLSPQIPFGKVDAGSAGDTMTATVDGITELRNGVCAYIQNGVVTSKATWTLNVNGLGAKPVYQTLAAATRSTTIFNVNYTMLFVYNESRVEGGCWDIFYGYNSDTNTIAYNVRRGNSSLKVHTALYRYQFCFTKDEETVLPVNAVSNKPTTYNKALTTEAFNPFAPIYYYATTTTVASGSKVASAYMYTQYSSCDMRYSFNINVNSNPLTADKDVYLVCVPQSDGLVKLHSSPISQALPSTADGLVYIHLGRAYLASGDTAPFRIALDIQHPIYQFKDNKLQLWTGA